MGAGESKGVGVVVFGGWLALATLRPQLAYTPAGPGNTETPHQGQLTALDQRTYDQEEGARSTEGLPWRAFGRGPRVVVAAGGCFLRSHAGYHGTIPVVPTVTLRLALRLCNWSALFESPL
jgi:hypothetical protein